MSITSWRRLAQVLAQQAAGLRMEWIRLGQNDREADTRAQEAVCALLTSWWLAAGRTPTPDEGGGLTLRPDEAFEGGIPLALRQARELLDRADRPAILRDFATRHAGADPVTHFYERFLAEYDPGRRMCRGVFYTPRPVARFIVQAVHECLQRQFGFAEGLAHTGGEARVRIIDPAAGTGAFLIEVIEIIHHSLQAGWMAAGCSERDIPRLWQEYAHRYLGDRLAGFELMPAACAIANLNVALKLRETGCRDVEPCSWVRPANSLELPTQDLWRWPGSGEGQSGPVVAVVVGNPPYAIGSGNAVPGFEALLADYKQGLNETNINALSDDYVKFIRLAHAVVAGAGAGVIGYVTNNSFLEGVTHRRMRDLLLRDFDDVQVLDLHGSVMRRGEAPAGVNDESVFEIQQGVAITVLARLPHPLADSDPLRRPADPARVHRSDLWGTRRHKYERLEAGPGAMKWEPVACAAPHFFFRAGGCDRDAEYWSWPSLAEVFRVFSSGIKFRKDGLLIKRHFTRGSVEEMLRDVEMLPGRELMAKYGFRETTDWRLDDKRELFSSRRPEDIVEVMYRPFDIRYAFYPLDRAGRIIVRGDSRVELMRHVLGMRNIGLLFNRQVVGDEVTHFLVSRRPVSHGTFYLGNKGQDYFAPLYLLDGGRGAGQDGHDRRVNERLCANLEPTFISRLQEKLQRRGGGPVVSPWAAEKQAVLSSEVPAPVLSPESVLHYLYAVFHSPAYRVRYAGPLKVDFPRVPWPADASLFVALCRLGADLVGLHLLEDDYPDASWAGAAASGPLARPLPVLAGTGQPTVAPGYPKCRDGRVYLNASCWLEGISEDTWGFRVGGYCVCHKWLKDRRGRLLSADDLRHYGRLVLALGQTRRLMDSVDEVIVAHGGWPGAFGGEQ